MARPASALAAPPHLRRLPVPSGQPPYDDEIGIPLGPPDAPRRRRRGRTDTGQGVLALVVTAGDRPAASPPEPSPRLRLVGESPDPPDDQAETLPDPRRWAAKLAQGALESVYGHRPVKQLTRWTDQAVYAALVHRSERQEGRRPAARPRIRTVRVCRVNARVAEASAVVQIGSRPLALALRFEAVNGRWLCTAFELLDDHPDQRPVREPSMTPAG